MSDDIGLFEHADGVEPKVDHGYCVDDVARGLVVLMREPEPGRDLRVIGDTYLEFVIAAQSADGMIANRRNTRGRWTSRPGVGDWWGRAIWGLGSAAARHPDPATRQRALEHAELSMRLRAPWPRSMAFAALGAAEIAATRPGHPESLALLDDAAAVAGGLSAGHGPRWPWPEPRLAYANAALAESLLAAGEHLPDMRLVDRGLGMLEWLLAEETLGGHLSVTPSGGAGPGRERPAFEQQAIEVAALADACHRAASVTGDRAWLVGVELAVGWFLGDNDTGVEMYDPDSGGGFDGLRQVGRNENRGAESTLAALATLQLGHALVGGRR